jgi:hypothetical protein
MNMTLVVIARSVSDEAIQEDVERCRSWIASLTLAMTLSPDRAQSIPALQPE